MEAQLFPPQQEVLDHGFFDLGFSSILSLRTGAGKTTLAEIAMDKALARGERVVYMTPLKALAEEKLSAWRERWRDRKVGIFTGDYEGDKTPVPYRDAEIIICTYERLDGILRHWQRHLHWLAELGVVVVDEIHLLTERSRGSRLEGALSRLMRVNPFCRVLGLSATVSNHAELADWLGGVSYHSDWRPVALNHEVRHFKRVTDKPDRVIDVVAETSRNNGQTLVFTSSRRRAEQLAQTIVDAGYSASHHHAGLDPQRRRQTEADFRDARLKCLVATPTLEMGLNLPCQSVVIADNTQYNGESFAPLPVWKYLQRAGRAGRPGQDHAGRAVLLAPSWGRKKQPDYSRATPEPIRSQMGSPANLAEQVLIEVASRSCRTREQLAGAFLPSTLAYHQDPGIKDRLQQCVDDMIEAGILQDSESAILSATRVGRVAVRHHLSPASTGHCLDLTKTRQTLSDFDLLLHHCWDGSLQPQLPVYVEVVDLVEELIRDIPSVLLDAPPPQSMAPRACAAGVLMAVVAWHCAQDNDVADVCAQLDVYPYDAEVLRDNLVRLLRASSAVHDAADLLTDPERRSERERHCGPSMARRLSTLALRLEHGLSGEAVDLAALPGCGGVLARRLLDAGITDPESLCHHDTSQLAAIPGVGKKRAEAWIEAADKLIKDDIAQPPPPPGPHNRTIAPPAHWPAEIDPGRLQRALDLRVSETPKGAYIVSGGADEHCVTDGYCDCADFEQHPQGWWCKHRLAVRLSHNDQQLEKLAQRIAQLTPPETLAGHLADLALGRRWHHG